MSYYNSTPISQLPPADGVQATDIYPATDTTDDTESPSGTTKKYTVAQLQAFLQVLFQNSNVHSCKGATTSELDATYVNGSDPTHPGVGAILVNNGTLATFTCDGISGLAVGDRILVQYQTNQATNGIYTINSLGSNTTPWVLVRATDYNGSVPNEITQGDFVGVTLGTINGLTFWFETAPGPFAAIDIGTSAITFEQSAAGSITGIVPLDHGGTSAALVASAGSVVYSGASALALSAVGSAGQVFQSNGTSPPSWSVPTYPSASGSAGKILRSDGTNNIYSTAIFADTYTASSLLYSDGTNNVTGLATANSAVLTTDSSGVPAWSSTMTDGQIIIGSTGATPTAATLTAGTNIAITNGAASITIDATGSAAFSWMDVTGTSQNMSANTGYIADNGALVTLTLPVTITQGSILEIAGNGAGGWTIVQNSGQQINYGNIATTLGAGGSISSTNRYDCIRLLCTVADSTFTVLSSQGSLNVI